jgi:hypothetical protein
MTAPNTAEKVCRGTPSQSAQVPYSRLSSTIVSPTSKNTACKRAISTLPPQPLDTRASLSSPTGIHVQLDQPNTPRLTRALTLLLQEINTTPPHLPGDPRPITYSITARPT